MAAMTHVATGVRAPAARGGIIRNCLVLLAVLVAAYVVLPQIGSFQASFTALRSVKRPVVALALALSCGAYSAAAACYYLLALKPLRYGATLVVQLANLLINRVVPAGIGGLGLNYRYLRTNRHNASQSVAVVSLNTIIGLVGNLLLLLGIILYKPSTVLEQFRLPVWRAWWGLILAVMVIAIGLSLRSRWFRPRLARFWVALRKSFGAYRARPARLGLALGSSMMIALCNAGSFWLCCRATELHVAFAAAFIIFSLSVVIGTATPTPGGLGGVEAGLVAGLVAARVPADVALATVLLYRLLAYWLPLLFGAMALFMVRRQGYVRWTDTA